MGQLIGGDDGLKQVQILERKKLLLYKRMKYSLKNNTKIETSTQ